MLGASTNHPPPPGAVAAAAATDPQQARTSSERSSEYVPTCPATAGDHDAAANATAAGLRHGGLIAEELRRPVPTLQDVGLPS